MFVLDSTCNSNIDLEDIDEYHEYSSSYLTEAEIKEDNNTTNVNDIDIKKVPEDGAESGKDKYLNIDNISSEEKSFNIDNMELEAGEDGDDIGCSFSEITEANTASSRDENCECSII